MRLPLRFNSAARQFQKAFFVHHLSFVFLSMEDAAPVLGAAFSGSLGTLLRVRSRLWDVMCVRQTCCGDCDFCACRGAHPCLPAFLLLFYRAPRLSLCLSGTGPQRPRLSTAPPRPCPAATGRTGAQHGLLLPGRLLALPFSFRLRELPHGRGTCFSHSRVIAYSVSFSMVVSFLCRKQVRASTWFSGIEVVICFFILLSSAPSSQKADLGWERDFRRARQRTQAG